MMKFRSKEVNDLPKATRLCGSKDRTQPEPWAQHLPRTSKDHSPGASPALKHEPQEEATREAEALSASRTWQPLTWATWGAAKAARPSRRAALPACPRAACASCPPPSADARLFGKLAPNPPPSVSSASLGYLVVLQTNLQVFKVTRVRGACRNVSFRRILLKLKI